MQTITVLSQELKKIRETYLKNFENPEGRDVVTPFDHFFYKSEESHQISKGELSDLRSEYFCVVEEEDDPFEKYLGPI